MNFPPGSASSAIGVGMDSLFFTIDLILLENRDVARNLEALMLSIHQQQGPGENSLFFTRSTSCISMRHVAKLSVLTLPHSGVPSSHVTRKFYLLSVNYCPPQS